jgi:hypothetical protein
LFINEDHHFKKVVFHQCPYLPLSCSKGSPDALHRALDQLVHYWRGHTLISMSTMDRYQSVLQGRDRSVASILREVPGNHFGGCRYRTSMALEMP